MDVRYTAFPLDVCSTRNSWFRWTVWSGNTALNASLPFMPFSFQHPNSFWLPFYWWGCELLSCQKVGFGHLNTLWLVRCFRRQLAGKHADVCSRCGNWGFVPWASSRPLNHPLLFLRKAKFKPGFSRMTSLFLHLFHALFMGLVLRLVSNYCSDVAELVPRFQQPSHPRETAVCVAG